MIKNSFKKTKCNDIEASDDYRLLTDNLSNPYCFNFGKISRNQNSVNFQKLHNKVNFNYFNKK